MRFIILLFVVSSAFAQDTTAVRQELNALLKEHQKGVEEARLIEARRVVLEAQIQALEAQLVKARIGDGGISILLDEDAKVFPGPRETGGERLISARSAMLVAGQGGRIKFVAANGDTGWVSSTSFVFTSDPTDYLLLASSSPDFNSMSIALLQGAKRKWESDQKTMNRQQEADAKVAEIERQVKESRDAAKSRQQEAERGEKEWIQKGQLHGAKALLKSFYFTVNSAGGVEPLVQVQNISEKRIKYTTLEVRIFNPVGDPAPDKYGSSNLLKLQLVGPIEPMESGLYSYDSAVYYNSVAKCGEVHKVMFEFTDGTTYTSVNDLLTTRKNRSEFQIKGECALN